MERRSAASGRILCTGDIWCHAQSGLSSLLEAQLRLEHPQAPWRFWHQGEATTTVRQLLEEAAWRLLGRDAHRVLISIGHSPKDQEASPEMLADLRALMELLADKLPGQVWILLPSPSLWPESQRDAALRIRQELSNPREGVRLIDVEEEVHAFLAAQDPEHGTSLCQPGPAPTPTGALMASQAVVRAWA
ncbi:MAG: hypothetical protein RL318_1240 [Fibrobacterota bacterium]|jgi:hypothetical protein